MYIHWLKASVFYLLRAVGIYKKSKQVFKQIEI